MDTRRLSMFVDEFYSVFLFFLFFSKEESAPEEENGGATEAIRGVLLKMSFLQCTHQSNPEGELIKLRLRISLKIFCNPIKSYSFVMKYNQFSNQYPIFTRPIV